MGSGQREKHTAGTKWFVSREGWDPDICWNAAVCDLTSREGHLHEAAVLPLPFVQCAFTEQLPLLTSLPATCGNEKTQALFSRSSQSNGETKAYKVVTQVVKCYDGGGHVSGSSEENHRTPSTPRVHPQLRSHKEASLSSVVSAMSGLDMVTCWRCILLV